MRVLDWTPWVMLALLAVTLGACGASPNSHPGQGIVKEIDSEARQVTLDHEDIPGLMKGMTMTFDVAPDVPLEGLEPGAEVDFRVKEAGGAMIVTELRRTAP